ncbi:MAG: tetratricopeptide repeat protein [Hellea sp.]|nr:tetratricopeptide repeat protein [Hellea sp.]
MSKKLITVFLGTSVAFLSGCSIASNYTESEQEIVSNMSPAQYQPSTREMRTNINTQDLLAQAAFWSREYQLNPADLEAAVKLAAAVRKMGNPGKAVEITQTSRSMYPDDPYLIAEYAAALIAMEKGSEATKPLDQALRAAPTYARLWSLKGAALDQMGNYDLARQHYNRALQLTPQDPNIMANMGLSYALAGDAVTAEHWLRQAAAHPNATDGIRKNLDLVLQLQGKAAHFGIPKKQAAAPQMPAQTQRLQQPQPSGAYGAYNPQAGQQPSIGHRSNVTIIGGQGEGPKSASDMARAAAAQSDQKRIVMPHQPQAQPAVQGQQIAPSVPQTDAEIMSTISKSVNQKYSAANPPVTYTNPQMYQPIPRQQLQYHPAPAPYSGNAYSQPGSNGERRGSLRRR